MPGTDSKVVTRIVNFAGAITVLLVVGYFALLLNVVHQAARRGPVDPATLGAITGVGPLVGAAVTGMFALLTSTRSSGGSDVEPDPEVHAPDPGEGG